MSELRWSIDDRDDRPGADEAGGDRAQASDDHERWSQGAVRQVAEQREAPASEASDDGRDSKPAALAIGSPWRRRIRRTLIVMSAVGAMVLAVRVATNARMLGRVEAEVERVVRLEHEAIAHGDQAVWSQLQHEGGDSWARRRFRSGRAGPVSAIEPLTAATPAVTVVPDVADARESGGRLRAADVTLVQPFAEAVDQGLFAERQRWQRDGAAWRRVRQPKAQWPEGDLPDELSEQLRKRLAEVRAAYEEKLELLANSDTLASGDGDQSPAERPDPLVLAGTYVTVGFLPPDAHLAADLVTRLDSWLSALCEAQPDAECSQRRINLTLDVPSAGFVIQDHGLLLPAPSLTWSPHDEGGRALLARQIMRFLLQRDVRRVGGAKAALIEAMLADIGAVPQPPRYRPGPQGPSAWTVWRWITVNAFGPSATVRPEHRSAAIEQGVTSEVVADLMAYIVTEAGLGGAQALLRNVGGSGAATLLHWLRTVFDAEAMSIALHWSAEPEQLPLAPRLITCDDSSEPVLLHPRRAVPLDVQHVACTPTEFAGNAALAPSGNALAVVCAREGSERIVLVDIDDRGDVQEVRRLAPVGSEIGGHCCVRWADDGVINWLYWPVRRLATPSDMHWRGIALTNPSAASYTHDAGTDAVPVHLGSWDDIYSRNHWSMPYWSPDGRYAVVSDPTEGEVGLRVYAVPPLAQDASADGDAVLQPLWSAPGRMPRWSPDGGQLAWLEPSAGDAREVGGNAGEVAIVVAGTVDGVEQTRIFVDGSTVPATGPFTPTHLELAGWAGDGLALVYREHGDAAANQEVMRLRLTLLALDLETETMTVVEERDTTAGGYPRTTALGLSRGPAWLANQRFRWGWDPQAALVRGGGFVYMPSEDRLLGEDERTATFAPDRHEGWTAIPENTVLRDDAGTWVVEANGLVLFDHDNTEVWRLHGPSCLP